MQEKAKSFTQLKGFVKAAADKHLEHVMRVKTQRQDLLKNEDGSPKIDVIGDIDSFKKMLAEQIEDVKKGRGRKVKNHMCEIMTYAKSTEEIEAVKVYLEQKFKRQFLAVRHKDEGMDKENAPSVHCHFLAAWRDKEGKGLRFQRQDIKAICEDIAGVLKQQITPAGEGRRSLPLSEYMLLKNRGEEKEQISAEVQSAERRNEIRKEKNMTMSDSEKYEIELMKALQKTYGDTLEFGIKKDSGIKKYKENITANLSDSKIVQQLTYIKKDVKDGWQVFFTPTQNFNTACLENLSAEKLGELPSNSFVMQTGDNTLTAHIPMPPASLDKANHNCELLSGYFNCRSYRVDSRRLFPLFSASGKTGKRLKLSSTATFESLIEKARKRRLEKINKHFGASTATAATFEQTMQAAKLAQQQTQQKLQPVCPTGGGGGRSR